MHGCRKIGQCLTVSTKLSNEAWSPGAGASWRRPTMAFISSESRHVSLVFDRCLVRLTFSHHSLAGWAELVLRGELDKVVLLEIRVPIFWIHPTRHATTSGCSIGQT